MRCVNEGRSAGIRFSPSHHYPAFFMPKHNATLRRCSPARMFRPYSGNIRPVKMCAWSCNMKMSHRSIPKITHSRFRAVNASRSLLGLSNHGAPEPHCRLGHHCRLYDTADAENIGYVFRDANRHVERRRPRRPYHTPPRLPNVVFSAKNSENENNILV